MLKEFKEFINRGNVIDLAIAVIIGGAFGAITTSLVNEVIMPVIGLLVGGMDFSALGIILKDAELYSSIPEAIEAGAPVLAYGAFINTIINFLIIAFALFMVVKAVNRMQEMRKKEEATEEAPAAPPEPSAEEQLLTEIRDLLAKER